MCLGCTIGIMYELMSFCVKFFYFLKFWSWAKVWNYVRIIGPPSSSPSPTIISRLRAQIKSHIRIFGPPRVFKKKEYNHSCGSMHVNTNHLWQLDDESPNNHMRSKSQNKSHSLVRKVCGKTLKHQRVSSNWEKDIPVVTMTITNFKAQRDIPRFYPAHALFECWIRIMAVVTLHLVWKRWAKVRYLYHWNGS